jgi:hypothetical protein
LPVLLARHVSSTWEKTAGTPPPAQTDDGATLPPDAVAELDVI